MTLVGRYADQDRALVTHLFGQLRLAAPLTQTGYRAEPTSDESAAYHPSFGKYVRPFMRETARYGRARRSAQPASAICFS